MAGTISSCWLILVITLTPMLLTVHADSQDSTKSYIVYTRNTPSDDDTPKSTHHMSMLRQALGSDVAENNVLVHSYKKYINGFVATLKAEDVQKVAEMENVAAVMPNGKKKLHTTRSWDFIGFPEEVKRANTESDIIIGIIDTGIWPDASSFNDSGYGPPPSKWKGSCHNFPCNNKIIGAKYFRINGNFSDQDIRSPLDSIGHGSHTASTVAGGVVRSASLYGLGLGTARGAVPSARLAIYKVCWYDDDCQDADLLAAFDEAIADGVDIISISLGGDSPQDYFNDTLAIGAFHAMRHGILTSTSAGNDGPALMTVNSVAPWLLSVAASTIDRNFVTKVQVGDDTVLEGISINTFDLKSTRYPTVHGEDVPNTLKGYNSSVSRFCLEDSMDRKSVKGKIVLCDGRFGPQKIGFASGATGIIIKTNKTELIDEDSIPFALPASVVNLRDGIETSNYVGYNITATILKSSHVNNTLAPRIAYFSGRGPNVVTLDILKPDITAPGVNILAAWSPISSPTEWKGDKRKANYNIISGTSMACPHVTGLAAYVKSFHPTWSPAAIKSAIMTTATPVMKSPLMEAEFAYGAGHVNPTKALNPGLVYDANETDYINFLCGQGYNDTLLQIVTGQNDICSNKVTHGSVWDLNYPSFAVSTISPLIFNARVFTRTVTNVGSPTSIYEATVTSPEELEIDVNPPKLKFTSLGQKLSFNVSVRGFVSSIASASLVWDDGTYQVRSPITVFLYKMI